MVDLCGPSCPRKPSCCHHHLTDARRRHDERRQAPWKRGCHSWLRVVVWGECVDAQTMSQPNTPNTDVKAPLELFQACNKPSEFDFILSQAAAAFQTRARHRFHPMHAAICCFMPGANCTIPEYHYHLRKMPCVAAVVPRFSLGNIFSQ